MENSSYGDEKNCHSKRLTLFLGLPMLVGIFAMPSDGFAAVWLPQETAVFDLVNHQRSINNLDSLQQSDNLHTSALGHSQSMADNDFFSHTTLVGDNGRTFNDRVNSTGYDWYYGGENIAGGHGVVFQSNTPVVQMEPMDAARHVMYGTANLDEYNAFFTNPVESWDEVGVGVSGEEWDDWNAYRIGLGEGDGGWMGSSDHRQNILSNLYDDIGVGYVWSEDDQTGVRMDDDPDTELPRFTEFPLYTYWTQDFGGDEVVSPVPLPGAFWLLGSALVSLIMAGRRRGVVQQPV